ncbi:MAG: hypothetical protein Q8P84_04355 [Deltaproteobacteria bacterium]|nr:hypothetical protein [Deltaproteobacteria bacterium]
MNKHLSISKLAVLAGLSLFIFSIGSGSARAAETQCKMNFVMKSWSVFYKSGKGSGTITCDNGQNAKVRLRMHGGGLTFGKDKTLDGHGTFSKTADIKDLFGSYATAETHGGAGDSGASQALTKGDVSLALTGSGKGVNIGIDFGSFKISKI